MYNSDMGQKTNRDRMKTSLYFRTMLDLERGFLDARMRATGWNRSQAARELGLNRTTLLSRLKLVGLEAP